MQQISPRGTRPRVGQDIVQRLAEQGYQLEPEALEIICRYPGSKEELLRRIISSADRSVAVIGTSMVSCHLESAAARMTYSAKVAASSPSLPFPNPQLSSPGPSPQPPTSFSCLQDSSAKLKCDITGRSTCVGDYNDFVHYFRDRFSKIREILSRRLNSRPIESLGKSTTGREVSLIGMVMDVKTTSKGNRVIELEDPTGMITAVIQKDAEVLRAIQSHYNR